VRSVRSHSDGERDGGGYEGSRREDAEGSHGPARFTRWERCMVLSERCVV